MASLLPLATLCLLCVVQASDKSADYGSTTDEEEYLQEYPGEELVQIHSCCVTRDETGLVRGACRLDGIPYGWRRWDYRVRERPLCTWFLDQPDGQPQGAGISGTFGDADGFDSSSALCVFSSFLLEVTDRSTFRVVTGPGRKIKHRVPITPFCEMDCGWGGLACDHGMRCIPKWQVCDFHPNCADEKDESMDVCHWWCAIDHKGNTCILMLVIAGSVVLVISFFILIVFARPSKLKGTFLERRRPSGTSGDKFEIVRLWGRAFLYYSACCCCRIFAPSPQKGKLFEEWEVPNEPPDDKFQAAGRFARKNCLTMAGLWLKALLYYCAGFCCGVFVPSRKRGKLLEKLELPTEDPELPKGKMEDKFAIAGRFARKNCLDIFRLWLQGIVYYICCCFLMGKRDEAPADEEPVLGAESEQGDETMKVPPAPMDMKRPPTDYEQTPDVVVTTDEADREAPPLCAA